MARVDDGIGRRLQRSLAALAVVLAVGIVGYLVLGFSPINAVYQTVTTITTVGFKEVEPFGTSEKLFTVGYLLLGVGVLFYTLTALLGFVVEGYLGNVWEGRRMQRDIAEMSNHAIVCGWGRVGRAAAHQLTKSGVPVVVVDADEDRLADCPYPRVTGDATRDDVLRATGIERARTLVATLDTDAASLYVTLSAHALNPGLTIIARARTDDAEQKFRLAGASRVVNPQRIGGNRIAAFALQPHVVDFLDVAMHDADVEFRLEEILAAPDSALAGSSMRENRLHEGSSALLLALRSSTGAFVTNPPPETVVQPGDVVIAVGTQAQLDALRSLARKPGRRSG